MSQPKRRRSTLELGHDAFLDIVANLVGILIILVVVLGSQSTDVIEEIKEQIKEEQSVVEHDDMLGVFRKKAEQSHGRHAGVLDDRWDIHSLQFLFNRVGLRGSGATNGVVAMSYRGHTVSDQLLLPLERFKQFFVGRLSAVNTAGNSHKSSPQWKNGMGLGTPQTPRYTGAKLASHPLELRPVDAVSAYR